MLFALIDYIKYRLKMGRYSDHAIQALGGKLATIENFPHPESVFRFGDVLIYHGSQSFLSWTVMYYTNSVWSHTACIVDDMQLVDATTSGVIKHPFTNYLDGNGYIVVKRPVRPITPAERENMCQFLEAQIGKGFNWHGVFMFWLHIVFGNHKSYRVKFSLDFLMLIAVIGWCLSPRHIPLVALTTFTLAYLIIVIVNIVRLKLQIGKVDIPE